ncbi:PucR family transcriptional regulator [Intrasporangium calvum]|uniref:PucR family transcriptional regulator n=1 Tax=Intrasporangium calvum TaxID=53358 RepID=A0ABT5GE74_9MICO|nr:PucR family transcriptional regulator [Intrasporangium calvum]MDC5696547.1 PucR family transcriptional regulator [Intrasporangium calvum]
MLMRPDALTVAEILDLDVVVAARPELVTPVETAQRRVRWVHTSEIYEIGPLLRGDELLLTTGLGLVGASPERLRNYVDSLADRGAAGLCLELGRPFERMPPPLVQQARDRGLALVAMHSVVPFVEVTEAVHELLVSSRLRRARAVDLLADDLLAQILGGTTVEALLRSASVHVGCALRLLDSRGGLIAESPSVPGLRPIAELPAGPSPAGSSLEADVVVGGRVWGRLVGDARAGRDAPALLHRAASLVAVMLLRTDAATTTRGLARRSFIHAISGSVTPHSGALEELARRAGMTLRAGQQVAVAGLDVAHVEPSLAAASVEAALRRNLGSAIASELDQGVLVLAAVPGGSPQAGRALLVDTCDAAIHTSGGRVRAIVIGPAVADLGMLHGAVGEVREGLGVSPAWPHAAGEGCPVLSTTDLALAILLARGLPTGAIDQLVDRTLRRVLEHDARRSAPLLPTLEAYLAAGGNKRGAAAALGVQRQTLYSRLARLAELIDLDLLDPMSRTTLHAAVLAWRLRSGGSGFRIGAKTSPSSPR